VFSACVHSELMAIGFPHGDDHWLCGNPTPVSQLEAVQENTSPPFAAASA
jgi:hypothetical protein